MDGIPSPVANGQGKLQKGSALKLVAATLVILIVITGAGIAAFYFSHSETLSVTVLRMEDTMTEIIPTMRLWGVK